MYEIIEKEYNVFIKVVFIVYFLLEVLNNSYGLWFRFIVKYLIC